jgi:hypothetical protein
MYKILIYLSTLLIFTNQVYAGSSTILATPGTGPATYDVITDSGGNFVGMFALVDGTAAANRAAVKAASTAAGATDPALVVAISPNNTVAVTESGTWNIGTVTTVSTVTAVTSITNALPAGTNLMGKVGIDQTTVGTTNGISIAQIGATTVSTGTGAVGTGSQRVAVGTDTATIAGSAPGTAGSASSNVLSVQGIASMTPLLANPGTAANWGVGTSTQKSATVANGQLALAQFNTSPTTITTGNMSPLQLDNAGNLLVNIKAGAGSGGTAITDNAAFTTGTTSETPIGCYAGTPSATANHSTVVSCSTAGVINVDVTNSNANGSATSANSSPVVIASDQAAVAIKAASASIASGAIASGAVAAGAYVSGSILSGALASGAVVDLTNLSGATGSAVPSKAAYSGVQGSSGLAGQIVCDQFITYDASTNGSTQLVALSSGKSIYVCGYAITTGSTATNVKLIYGTGTACVTSPQPVLPAFELGANSGIVDSSALWGGIKTTASQELCINTSAGNPVQAVIKYAQF